LIFFFTIIFAVAFISDANIDIVFILYIRTMLRATYQMCIEVRRNLEAQGHKDSKCFPICSNGLSAEFFER